MKRDEYSSYLAEINELESLLAEIPHDKVLERMSLEDRLRLAKSAIANIDVSKLNETARLTFRGDPVSGSHGTFADFGSKAAGAFSDAVSASKRLQENNIQEKTEKYVGEFQGILPTSRAFEFKPSNQTAVMKGKISQNIKDPDALNRDFLHKHVEVEMSITRVGAGKPRYTLSSLAVIHIIN